MPAMLVTVPTVMQNSFINFLLIACHLLDFMVQGKITEADAPTSHHPIRTIGAPYLRHYPFLPRMPFLPQPSQFILA